MSPTADRLPALAVQLGDSPARVAQTLHAEVTAALAEIDAGVAARDAERIERAAHAARNSVLMLDEQPVLDALRALSTAAGRADEPAVRAARGELAHRWATLAATLQSV